MTKYILKRLLMLIPVVIGISLFIFLIMSLAPGDPVLTILGPDASAQQIAEKRAELGLDKNVVYRYLLYMGGVIRGDLGNSWMNGYNVFNEFIRRLPNTMILAVASIGITAIIGTPMGIIAAVKQYSIFDNITLLLALILSSVPGFWLGLMAQIYFALKLGWLPATGIASFKSFILPSLTLSAVQLAGQVRLTRTSMLDVIKQDYVRTARAKGAKEFVVIVKHVMRNALMPVVTSMGISIAILVGSTTITETVFSVPGIGSMMINAIKVRDVPVVMGVILFIAIFVGVVNLIVDIIYAYIDPRVKLDYKA